MLGATERPPLKTGLYQVIFKSRICIAADSIRSTFEFNGITVQLEHHIHPIVLAITHTPCECGFSVTINNQSQVDALNRLLKFLACWLEIEAADMQLWHPDGLLA